MDWEVPSYREQSRNVLVPPHQQLAASLADRATYVVVGGGANPRKQGATMTTRVQIEIIQQHIPVAVDVVRSDGTVSMTMTLRQIGQVTQEYVHSGQTLRVREMTTEEMHNAGL